MPVNLYMVLYENRLEFGQFMQFCGMIVHLITSYCLLSGIFIESNYILNCQIELIWVVGVDFDTINLTSNSGTQVRVYSTHDCRANFSYVFDQNCRRSFCSLKSQVQNCVYRGHTVGQQVKKDPKTAFSELIGYFMASWRKNG